MAGVGAPQVEREAVSPRGGKSSADEVGLVIEGEEALDGGNPLLGRSGHGHPVVLRRSPDGRAPTNPTARPPGQCQRVPRWAR